MYHLNRLPDRDLELLAKKLPTPVPEPEQPEEKQPEDDEGVDEEESVAPSESRVSVGKSTYTYLNSLEQRLEEERSAREKLEKELDSIRKELASRF